MSDDEWVVTAPPRFVAIAAAANRYRAARIRHRVVCRHVLDDRSLGDLLALCADEVVRRRAELDRRLTDYLGDAATYAPMLAEVLDYYAAQEDEA